jgi:hypothetical protein
MIIVFYEINIEIYLIEIWIMKPIKET